MPNWFSKVFKSKEETAVKTAPASVSAVRPAEPEADERPKRAPMRNVIEPTVIDDGTREEAAPEGATGIRIKAAVAEDMQSCKFMVDRPVFEGYSVYAHDAESAAACSPLAEALFALPDVSQVEIFNMNVTLTRAYKGDDWEDLARAAGAVIRGWLEEGKPVVTEDFLDNLPDPDAIGSRLQEVIDDEINPGIAAHSGEIALNRIEGNTVFIRMMGGCQGCAASDITLKIGIHQAFRDAVPQIGAILDETDHSAGTNPFYTALPAGMQ